MTVLRVAHCCPEDLHRAPLPRFGILSGRVGEIGDIQVFSEPRAIMRQPDSGKVSYGGRDEPLPT